MKTKSILMVGIVLAMCAAIVTFTGCGGSTGGSTPPPVNGIASITISCSASPCAVQTSTNLTANTIQLTATVTCNGTCNKAVTWSVASGNGTVDNNGLYTAATTVPTGGSATVKALGSDGVTSATITIAITQGPTAVLVAYMNGQYSNSTCGNNGEVQSCEMIYDFNLATPTTQTRLTPLSLYQDIYPAISPDQSTIAYVSSYVDSNGNAVAAVYTVPWNGGTPTLIKAFSQGAAVFGIGWKLDGSAFVIAQRDPATQECGIATLPKTGADPTPIAVTDMACPSGTSITNAPERPHYLLDGRIVYDKAGPGGNAQIFVISADGTAESNISNNGANDWEASPAPSVASGEQQQIVFIRGHVLTTMYVDGTGAAPIPLQNSVTPQYPAWCPGNKILFVDFTGSNSYNLWTVGTDGSGEGQLTTGDASFMPDCR